MNLWPLSEDPFGLLLYFTQLNQMYGWLGGERKRGS